MSGRLVAEMVYAAVFWLNTFYPGQTLSNMSPRSIVTGLSVDFNKHCKHEFGTYVQTYEDTDNTMRARTMGALALRPTGNSQGGHFYLSLTTGRRLNQLHAAELSMPKDVITQVHRLARHYLTGLEFCDRTGNVMNDNEIPSHDNSNSSSTASDNSNDSDKYDDDEDRNFTGVRDTTHTANNFQHNN